MSLLEECERSLSSPRPISRSTQTTPLQTAICQNDHFLGVRVPPKHTKFCQGLDIPPMEWDDDYEEDEESIIICDPPQDEAFGGMKKTQTRKNDRVAARTRERGALGKLHVRVRRYGTCS